MKKIFVGLLLLGSVSAFASVSQDECDQFISKLHDLNQHYVSGTDRVFRDEIDQAFKRKDLISCSGISDTPLTAMLSGLRSTRTGVELALRLIQEGADIKIPSKDYDLTPLDYALGATITFNNESTWDDEWVTWGDQSVITRNLKTIIPLLIEKGADIERVSKFGVSTSKRLEKAELLLGVSLKAY